ncbi:MAG TPA: helix-turn-helix transcriptional regulator [Thermomicrobiales bacterium]|jgi:DNA-binding CsgD family transcriptional regulator|nr:helix-turn-helix transcriptional regulator [Thermomicrobiales bacterium]
MRLTRAQAAAIERIDRISRTPASPEDVATATAEALRDAVPWDGYRLFAIDPVSGDITRLLAAATGDGEMRQRWLRDAYKRGVNESLKSHQHDARLEKGLRVLTIHEQLDRCFGMDPVQRAGLDAASFYRGYHLHREQHHPDVSHLNAVLVNFPVGGRWAATLQAYRIDSKRAFTATDIAFIRLVAPRVGEVIETAMRREQMKRLSLPVPADGASGVLIVHASRGVDYASPAGKAWLEELARSTPDHETLLPASILAAISGIGAGSDVVVTTIPTRFGMISVEATVGGNDGTVALIISPPAGEPVLVAPSSWRLTPAEERIAVHVVQGLSNRAIADQLSVSEHTVEWHLRRIYEKIEVVSRSQLAARFVQDVSANAGA